MLSATQPSLAQLPEDPPTLTRLYACYSYGCRARAVIRLSGQDARRFAEIFARSGASAEGERRAISDAVRHYENLATAAIGVRDLPKSPVIPSGLRGQMDCIDESRNTRHLLLYLKMRGLLRHHTVERNVSRGMLLDGRYFHSTAVVRASDGRRWAVDSWYEAGGGAPDIIPLDEWRQRGVGGKL